MISTFVRSTVFLSLIFCLGACARSEAPTPQNQESPKKLNKEEVVETAKPKPALTVIDEKVAETVDPTIPLLRLTITLETQESDLATLAVLAARKELAEGTLTQENLPSRSQTILAAWTRSMAKRQAELAAAKGQSDAVWEKTTAAAKRAEQWHQDSIQADREHERKVQEQQLTRVRLISKKTEEELVLLRATSACQRRAND